MGTGSRRGSIADEAGSPVARDVVVWVRLRDGAGNWDEYLDFLAAHPDWPGLQTLRRAGERQMPSGMPPEQVFAFFATEPPQTGIGSLRLAEALSTAGREAEAEAEIVRAWETFSMAGRRAGGGAGALEDRRGAEERGAARHAAMARADERGRGDAAGGLARLAEARTGADRHARAIPRGCSTRSTRCRRR